MDGPAPRPVAWVPADDVPLVEAARAGDAAAFDALYRRHARVVHGVLLARATRADVDDLVQDVFLTAWQRLSTLRDAAAFAGWLVTIARHARIDRVRRYAAADRHGFVVVAPDGTGTAPVDRVPSVEVRADDRLEARQALDAIRALPPAYRDTLALRLVEGLTGPEIAARTGLTPESVRVNLCRGMKLLRDALTARQHRGSA